MVFLLRFLLLGLLTAPVLACAHKTVVALVPDPDGKVGMVSVANGKGKVFISAPFQATTVAAADQPPTAPKLVGENRLYKGFADSLSVQPQQPLHFQLYFRRNTTFTPDSVKTLPIIVQTIRERKSTYISIIGHTDTVYPKRYNLRLSSDRAKAVKDFLVKHGVNAKAIWTVLPEGEEYPFVATPDEVYEPSNRWVEVIVR